MTDYIDDLTDEEIEDAEHNQEVLNLALWSLLRRAGGSYTLRTDELPDGEIGIAIEINRAAGEATLSLADSDLIAAVEAAPVAH